MFTMLVLLIVGLLQCYRAHQLRTEVLAWQEAAQPVFDARGMKVEDPKPQDLKNALDINYPVVWQEHFKITGYYHPTATKIIITAGDEISWRR